MPFLGCFPLSCVVAAMPVEVVSTGVTDYTVNLKDVLEKGASMVSVETSGELKPYLTPGTLTGTRFSYSTTANDGGLNGTCILTVSSLNFNDYTVTVNFASAKKVTEVELDTSSAPETALTDVTVKKLEDFTDAQPEAVVEVRMDVKPESEEVVAQKIGSAGLSNIKGIVGKTFAGVGQSDVKQEYLDITVTKAVNGGTPQNIADVNRVLEIEADYDNTIRELHYMVTPYTYKPAGNYKLINNLYHDIGQGLIECMNEIEEEAGRKADA